MAEITMDHTTSGQTTDQRGVSHVGCNGGLGQLAQRYWKAPFRYEDEGSMIWDANGERVIDIRGWGYLTGGGEHALGLSYSDAAKIQDDFGQTLVALLNASWPNTTMSQPGGQTHA